VPSSPVQVGSPPQNITIRPDTGYSETWLNPNCNDPSLAYPRECQEAGTYLFNKSTSAYDLHTSFSEVDSLTGASANGTYFEDNVILGGNLMYNVMFGVANSTAGGWTLPIMGLSGGRGKNTNYSTIIDRLKDDGFIQNRDFSISAGTSDTAAGMYLDGPDQGREATPRAIDFTCSTEQEDLSSRTDQPLQVL
jgi:hypothetical protein